MDLLTHFRITDQAFFSIMTEQDLENLPISVISRHSKPHPAPSIFPCGRQGKASGSSAESGGTIDPPPRRREREKSTWGRALRQNGRTASKRCALTADRRSRTAHHGVPLQQPEEIARCAPSCRQRREAQALCRKRCRPTSAAEGPKARGPPPAQARLRTLPASTRQEPRRLRQKGPRRALTS